jgi:hypothetical protein
MPKLPEVVVVHSVAPRDVCKVQGCVVEHGSQRSSNVESLSSMTKDDKRYGISSAMGGRVPRNPDRWPLEFVQNADAFYLRDGSLIGDPTLFLTI